MKRLLVPLMLLRTSIFIGIILFLILSPKLFVNPDTQAAGGDCEDAQAQSIEGTGDLVTFNAPSGNTITQVCVKASTDHFKFTSNTSDGCYTVSGIGTGSTTVERTGTPSSECQEISHIDVYYEPSPTLTPTPPPAGEPTPTESPTPTEEPTPTSNPTPTPEEENEGGNNGGINIIVTGSQPTLTPTPPPAGGPTTTPAATATPTPTITSTPTPTPTSAALGLATTPTPTPTSPPSVLGISAARQMPVTGNEPIWFYISSALIFGGSSLIIQRIRNR